MNLPDLCKPFPPDRISWRVGSTTKDKTKGMALAYIDARDVQDRLDEVCGMDGWQCRYVPMHDKKTVCEIGVLVARTNGGFAYEWVWKADGAGDSDVEAEKGALSDAFKRAAVKWGIGRYLYDLDSPWVELDTYEKNGQTFAKGIKPAEMARLKKVLAGEKTYAPNPDVDEGVKNWCDLQNGKIAAFTRLPDLLMWKDETEDALKRLLAKAPEAHKGVMLSYNGKFSELSKKKEPA